MAQRRPLMPMSTEQQTELERLYREVPQETRVVHLWGTPAGQALKLYAKELHEKYDVPVAWMAVHLGVTEQNFMQFLYGRGRG